MLVILHSTAIKTFTVTHGTINAGASSTVETQNITDPVRVVGINISGNYNSDCVVWSYYKNGNTFISRVKNNGANAASNIAVLYYYI